MSANNARNRFPRGEAVSFLFAACSKIFPKCLCELKNETDEECGRKCLLIANNGTSTCVLHRNRYRIYTKMKCVSRIPHPPLRGTFPPGEGIRRVLQIAFFDTLNERSFLATVFPIFSPNAPIWCFLQYFREKKAIWNSRSFTRSASLFLLQNSRKGISI